MNLIEVCKELYPIYRSITGNGVRDSLKILSRFVPFEVHEVPCGSQQFDWTVPAEWNIRDAYVIDLNSGEKVIDFKVHNLHIVGYSEPVDKECTWEELNEHLYYLENQPTAIPYITSYYKRRWGFCLSFDQYRALNRSAKYKVCIDSEFNENGSLTYAELLIPGKSKKEIFFSSYICHPQMCNNELSGPIVLTAIAEHVLQQAEREYSYRFVLVPETIGSVAYLAKNISYLKENVYAGFNISCVGDERIYSFLPSRMGNTIADQVARHVLTYHDGGYKAYTWLDRGSDERQYCAPGIDLPVCSITRSMYANYPEYHTSLDNFDLVTDAGLRGSVDAYIKCIRVLETNTCPQIKVLGEPQLGKRGLYPTVSDGDTWSIVRHMMDFVSYCDGRHTILEISDLIGVSYFQCLEYYHKFRSADLM